MDTKCKKDTIERERSEESIENKGVRVFRGPKRSLFECPKTQSNPRIWPKIYNLWGIE
jgi:hypothetical protein